MVDVQWMQWHGTRVFVLAAWYDCCDICERCIDCGTSPNRTCIFPPQQFWDHDSYFYGLRDGPREWKTADHYLPKSGYAGKVSSPLVEAAVQGNIKSVEAILKGGADVNLRCGGYTAAGYLLCALNKDNLNRKSRLETLRLLLKKEADVNEPFREGIKDFDDDNCLNCSDETLLDKTCLTGDPELIGLLKDFDKTPEALLSISSIVFNAERGIEDLQAYLLIATFPRGTQRRRIQERSLYRCFGKPKAFSSMIHANFDLRLPILSIRIKWPENSGRHDLGEHRDLRSIRQILTSIFDDMPLTSLGKDTISRLLRKETVMKAGLIQACLITKCEDDMRHLLDCDLNVTGQDGIVIMAAAARHNNFAAVSLLKNFGVEINGTLKLKKHYYSILLLAATGIQVDNELRLLQNNTCANIDMLEFLVSLGANINTCCPALRYSLCKWPYYSIEAENLKWLVDNGIDLTGESIYSMVTRRFEWGNSLGLLQSLVRRNVSIFSPDESLKDHRNFTTDIHPLSFFIRVKPGLEFIYRVLETGIDVDGTGRDIKTETPLRAAARIGDLRLVQELTYRGALITDTECRSEYTPLQLACGHEMFDVRSSSNHQVHYSLAQYLLENGADPNSIGKHTTATPLQLVLESSDPNIQFIELLLDHGADVNALQWDEDDRNGFILQVALARAEHLGIHKQRLVEMMIERGARINARLIDPGNKLSKSALEATCERNGPDCVDLVKLLLDRGAEPNTPDGYYESNSLEIACFHRNIDLIKLLLDRGMTPNRRSSYSGGPLRVAAWLGDLPIAILLLAAGADVSIGDSPLLAAAQRGKLDMVALLLEFETREEVLEDAICAAQDSGHFSIASKIQRYLDRGTTNQM
ncbi:MAG: hypothetical protein Q9165_003173 [Trypethelium subeluteriae]